MEGLLVLISRFIVPMLCVGTGPVCTVGAGGWYWVPTLEHGNHRRVVGFTVPSCVHLYFSAFRLGPY